jgi:hypothetical protein
LVCALALISFAGCRKGNLAGQTAQTTAPTLNAARPSRCGYSNRASKPLVVDWPAAERAALESRAMQGPVAVHWEGCEIEVLTTCNGVGDYAYAGLNPKQETVRIKNADELYANLPVGAASLEGKLERFGSLEVDMTVIGRKEADHFDFPRDELAGRCERATHVVTGLTVGAFTFSAGQGAALGGSAQMGNAGAGAQSSSSSELLNTDGDRDACVKASQNDFEPPPGCGSLLRVELVPVDEGGIPAPMPSTAANDRAPQDTGPTPPSPKATPEEVLALEKKANNMRLVYLSGYLGAVAFGLTSSVGFAMVRSSASDVEASKTDLGLREDAISKYRTGQILAWGGLGAAVLSAGVGMVGLAGQNKAKARLKSLSFAPTRGGASFGVEVAF